MTIGLVGRKCRHDPHLYRRRRDRSCNGHRSAAESRHSGEIRRQGRLPRHPGHLRQEAPAAAVEGRRRPLRESQRRAGPLAGGIPPRRKRRRPTWRRAPNSKPSIFNAGQLVDVTGTTIGKGFAGTMKRHNFAGAPCLARHLGLAPHPRIHRPAPDAGSRVPGQAHVGPHGRHSPHHRESESRRDRRRAQSAADPRRGAGRRRRPGHRASVGQGRAPGEPQEASRRARRPKPRKPTRSKATRHETQSRQWRRRAGGFRRNLRQGIQRSAGAPGRHGLSWRAAAPARRRRRPAPKCAAVAASRVPQKGTGSARAGSIRSPIWVGGGRAFAAKPRDFAQKVNRKMYRGALQSMLSELVRQDRLVVTQAFTVDGRKTKLLVERARRSSRSRRC